MPAGVRCCRLAAPGVGVGRQARRPTTQEGSTRFASSLGVRGGLGSLSIEPRHRPRKQRAGSRFDGACSPAVNNVGSSDRRRHRCAIVDVGVGASQRVSTIVSSGRQPSRIPVPSSPRGSCGCASRTTLVPSSTSTYAWSRFPAKARPTGSTSCSHRFTAADADRLEPAAFFARRLEHLRALASRIGE